MQLGQQVSEAILTKPASTILCVDAIGGRSGQRSGGCAYDHRNTGGTGCGAAGWAILPRPWHSDGSNILFADYHVKLKKLPEPVVVAAAAVVGLIVYPLLRSGS